jgi:tetratricopeptide (TPR) repeat protein
VRTRVLVLCASAVGILATASIAFADDSDTEKARQHYQKAQKAFDLGRWDDSIAEYEAAYSFRADPSFLYNMAQAYRRKGDAKPALDLYKNYLIKVPDSPQRADIEERIRQLQKQVDKEGGTRKQVEGLTKPVTDSPPTTPPPPSTPEAATTEAAKATPSTPSTEPVMPFKGPETQPNTAVVAPAADVYAQPAPPPGNRTLRMVGLAVGGAGILAIAGGIFFGARAKSLSDDVTSDAKKGIYDSSKYDDGQRAETLQWVSYGVGAAALIGGAVLYWRGMVVPPPEGKVAWTVAPNVGGKSVGGHLLMSF